MPNPYQYIVVKETNARGVLACQASHAAGESVLLEHKRDYDPSQIHIVMLVAKDSQALEDLGTTLLCNGVPHVVIREPDEPYRGCATAVGVAPTIDREAIRIFFAAFKVLH